MFSCNSLDNPIGIETLELEFEEPGPGVRCNSLENPIGIETLVVRWS